MLTVVLEATYELASQAFEGSQSETVLDTGDQDARRGRVQAHKCGQFSTSRPELNQVLNLSTVGVTRQCRGLSSIYWPSLTPPSL